MNPISLKKDTADGQIFSSDRYNTDQTAVENTINKITQSVTEGDAGANHVKTSPVAGTSAATVMDLFKYILSLGSGSLPGDATITDTKLGTDVKVGSIAALTTTVKTSVVAAINSLVTDTGALASLTTTVKTSVVAAINSLVTDTGALASLTTTAKTSLVIAINELVSSISTVAGNLTTHKTSADHDGRYYTASEVNTAFIPKSIIDGAGDLLYGSADNTLSRLPKGIAGQSLKINSGATAPEWGNDNFSVTPSETIILSSDTQRNTGSTVGAVLKSFTVRNSGMYRIYYEISNTNGDGTVVISINGTNVETYTEGMGGAWDQHTYNTTAAVPANSTIALSVKTSNASYPTLIQNVRIKGTRFYVNDAVITD